MIMSWISANHASKWDDILIALTWLIRRPIEEYLINDETVVYDLFNCFFSSKPALIKGMIWMAWLMDWERWRGPVHFCSLVALKFATIDLYHPEFYPYLSLNHWADSVLSCHLSAPIRVLFPRLLLYFSVLYLLKTLAMVSQRAHLLTDLLTIFFPTRFAGSCLVSSVL